jgi:hypothetical protein
MHREPTLCTGFRQCIYYNTAPICFGTYVPSSGSVFFLVSNVKTKAAMYGPQSGDTTQYSTTNRHTEHTSSRYRRPYIAALVFTLLTRTMTLSEDGT